MTDIGRLCSELYDQVEWQKMPVGCNNEDKEKMLVSSIIAGIKDLFVVTGRATSYYSHSYVYTEDDKVSEFSYDLLLDEELYVLCYAQMTIYKKVRTQYTELLGYTTNALTVTNADKPYAYLTSTINELSDRLKLYYYKMARYSHLD